MMPGIKSTHCHAQNLLSYYLFESNQVNGSNPTRKFIFLCLELNRIGDVPALFRYFDHDKDGTLSLSEFHCMVSELNIGISAKRVLDLFLLLDTDKSGGTNRLVNKAG